MTTPADIIASSLFGSLLARPAVYTPPDGGPAVPCRAVPAPAPVDSAYGETVMRAGLSGYKLLTTTVPLPEDGGRLAVEGVDHIVVGAPAAALQGRLWLVTVRTA